MTDWINRTCAVLILALLPVCAWSAAVSPAKDIASPAFTGPARPIPPHQHDPWTAPATLPPALISATTALFAEGLADPRGCEYRQIAVGTGSVWSGDGGVVQTHGWVLPAAAGQKQSFAVCWNGLVYPVISVGRLADLQGDVNAAMTADAQDRAQQAGNSPGFPFTRFTSNAEPEADAVSEKSLLPLKVCLLLRLGENTLARRFWDEWAAGLPPNVNNNAAAVKDPYLTLASDWTWSLFDQAVHAHESGDDRLAVLDARALTGIQPQVETEAARRGFARPYGDKSPYLDFLSPLPDLLADEERRVREPPRAHPVDPAAPAEKAQRIALLITDLENVSVRQMGQPGGVILSNDAIVQALIGDGEEAVPPLLDALVNDTRLTRSVSFHRDFFRDRTLIGVPEAAYVALCGILQTSFPDAGDLAGSGIEGRRRVAARVRAYWQNFQGLTPQDRWFRVLADDTLPPEQWAEAAGHIVQPDNVSFSGGGAKVLTVSWSAGGMRPGEHHSLAGQSLRARTAPSVTDLLLKRAEARTPQGDPAFALALAAWDGAAHLADLRRLTKQLQDQIAARLNIRTEFLVDSAVSLYLSRLSLHDPTAAPDYADWLRTVTPRQTDTQYCRLFEPAWNSADLAVADAVRAMFNRPDSPWVLLRDHRPNPQLGTSFNLNELIDTPLLSQPGFQEFLRHSLAETDTFGTVRTRPDGDQDTQMKAGSTPQTDEWTGDPLAPPPNSVRPFRLCDLIALDVSQVDGAPRCELYWPLAQRNEAVRACLAFLDRYGDDLRFDPRFQEFWEDSMDAKPHLLFPRLRHPATEADVRAGRAIFALTGRRRVVTLPSYPTKAHIARAAVGPAGDGYVWQVEEVWQHGRWERFYGFIGRYGVTKLPAGAARLTPPGAE